MAGEGDKTRWVGVRPTNPAENIPVDVKALVNVPIIPASPEKIFTRYEPPEGCTYVEAFNVVQGATAIVYTVPADTLLFITSIDFSVYHSVLGLCTLGIRNAADVSTSVLYEVYAGIGWPCAVPISYPIARQVPALYDVYIISSLAGVVTQASMMGYTRPV